MSEIKRVQLADAPDDQTASSTKNVSASKTIRFDFELFEPTADSFPEFNYSKLLYEEKKKHKKIVKKVNGFADPFEENDDDVNRIAKEFERKYGTICAGKKRSSNNNECDKGAGYDLNDGFIDNSEAYDELIPDEIETDRGGFYINSGALEFKNLPNYERPDDAARMPKPKKRALSTSSESSSSGNEESNKKQNSIKNGPNEKKPKLSDKDKHKNKEKKLKVKEKKDDGLSYDSDKDTKKVVKTTTVKDMLRAKRDSMRNMIDNGNKSEQTEESNRDTSSSEDSSDSSEDGSDGEKKDANCVQNGEAKLPDNLPPELLANIKKITESSKVSIAGKSNFFDSANMNLLFEIDTAARMKGGVVRNQVYTYLEKYLPCTKQTIMIRAKKIRSQKEEAKTNKIVKKLKMAVGNVMPDLVISYDKECELVNDLKASNVNGGSKSEQPIKNPKKKFLWTDVTRNILCEIINSRKQSYAVIKPRRESSEDFVNSYLREHVLKIWPEGWMKIEELLKEFEKRQLNNVKKPKESKKSIESASQQPLPDVRQSAGDATSTTLSNTTSISSTTVNATNPHSSLITEVKSLLSSNNSIVPNLKDTSVTVIPSVKSEDTSVSTDVSKTTTSPTPTFGSNLTITPIGVNDKMTSKPLASVQNQVTITNVESLSQPSKVLTTTPAITKTTTKDQAIVKSSTSSSASSAHTVNHNATKLSTKTPPLTVDMLSPPKKATDHSINSIISSTPPAASDSHSKTEVQKPADASSGGTTRIINLDNLSTNDILSTAAASSESNIRIKSVESLNKMVHKAPAAAAATATNPTKPASKEKEAGSKKAHSYWMDGATNAPQPAVLKASATLPMDSIIKSTAGASSKATQGSNQKNNFSATKPAASATQSKAAADNNKPVASASAMHSVEEISSDSDDVEFVSETHLKKVTKNQMKNAIKHIKSSNNSSRSSSPSAQAQASTLKRRRDSSIDGKDELDVKQIMEAIKELQEMQTNATGVHSSGSNSSHNKKSLHHSSSLPYNKKLDHLEHTSQLSKSSS